MTTKLINGDDRFVKPLLPWFDEEDIADIKQAYNLAKSAHYKQFRQDGRRYFEHVRGVAFIAVKELKVHEIFSRKVAKAIIIAALFHDLKEDRPWVLSLKSMSKLFGSIVSDAVRLLTKDEDSKPVYFPRMRASRNIIVLIVKLCDRLYNMRDLKACSVEKKQKQVVETEEFVLPLANLLESILSKRQKCVAVFLREKLMSVCKRVSKSFDEKV